MTVHNHPPYRPMCNERMVDGHLKGACMADEALCDGCGRVAAGVRATDDGRALMCPTCLPMANSDTATGATAGRVAGNTFRPPAALDGTYDSRWRWSPGDPCASCGSTDTHWAPDTGAACGGCSRTDADECAA